MPPSILEMAKDLTLAQIHAGNLDSAGVDEMMALTTATLRELHARENGTHTVAPEPLAPAILGGDYKRSIRRDKVICLECGTEYKILTAKHLATHDMNGQSYRDKYGIPHQVGLASRRIQEQRRETIRTTKPWEYAEVKRKGIKARKAKG